MKINKYCILKIFLILLMFVGIFVFWGQLPNEMPVHWNFSGQVDRYWPKLYALLLAPMLGILFVILFSVLSKIDPRKEKYQKFRKTWEIIQILLLSFVVYLQFIILYMSMVPNGDITKLMLIGIGILFVLIGNYMGKVRQNYFVGFKTPWALANEDVWNKTQRVGGLMFVFTGIVFIIEAFFKWYLLPVFIIVMVLTVILPILYSYWVFKQLEK